MPILRRKVMMLAILLVKDYKPDTFPKKASSLLGKELKHSTKTYKSTYAWFPIKWLEEKPINQVVCIFQQTG